MNPGKHPSPLSGAAGETHAAEGGQLATQDDVQKLRTELKQEMALLRGEIRELKTEFKNNISLIKIETQELETNMMLKLLGVLMIAVFAVIIGKNLF